MTEQQFDEIKNAYLENIKQYIVQAGGLFPHISIFADHKIGDNKNKLAIIHVPIPDKYLSSDEAKDAFVAKIIPDIAESVNEKFTVQGVAWASEAWMRHMPKESVENGLPSNWKDLPKKEVLIVTMETALRNEARIYEMHRTGLKVNDEGNMIDNIDLEELPDISHGGTPTQEGRFTGLYQKFLQHAAKS